MTSTHTPIEPGKAPALAKAPTGVVTALVPASISEVAQLSGMVARAGWAPLSYRLDQPKNQAGASMGRPEDMGFDEDKIAIGIMQGMEVGLKPIQALQSIAVINGIPALYGDSMLAVINATGQVEDFSEVPTLDNNEAVVGWTATMKRKSRPTATVRTFTVEDAKAAGLLDKAGPWKQYRSRMLQMRARALCLRDSFPDALKGLAMVEEVQDVTVTTVPLAAPAPRSAAGKLDAFADVPKPTEPEDAQFEEVPHDPATGEVIEGGETSSGFDSDGLPASVKVAFDAAKYTPFLQWLDVELQKLADAPDVKQGLIDRHAARLKTVHDSGKAAEAAVRKLVKTFMVFVDFIAGEAD